MKVGQFEITASVNEPHDCKVFVRIRARQGEISEWMWHLDADEAEMIGRVLVIEAQRARLERLKHLQSCVPPAVRASGWGGPAPGADAPG